MAYQIELSQLLLTYKTRDLRYKIMIKSWNLYLNKLENSIIMNQIFKVKIVFKNSKKIRDYF
jgi:hypothetical protein